MTAETTEVALDLEDVERESEDTDAAISNPFDPEEIDVVTRTPNVNLLLSRLRTDRLDLEPEFQRKAGIWNPRRQSRLIESLLLKIPLPTMYAAEARTGDDRWTVVDGVQRISTIASFVEPELLPHSRFATLSGLEYLKEYENKSYSELNVKLQTRIQETEFVLNLIRRGTPEPVMFNIFARINTGGAPLTRQELRHALTPGEGRVVLRELAESSAFRDATGGRVRTDRMEDREMILRFCAFYLRGVGSYGTRTDFDGFLTESMRELGELSATRMSRLRKAFNGAMGTAEAIFGSHAFRKSLPGYPRRAPINKALFETVACALANMSASARRDAVVHRDTVYGNFEILFSNPRFMSAVSQGTGDHLKVQYRHAQVKAALE